MKILAVCGHGLGSSFMLEMNIKKALASLGVSAEVEHSDLGSIGAGDADYFVMGHDIASSSGIPEEKLIVLQSIIDKSELEQKLREKLA